MTLQAGDRAPDFSLTNRDGTPTTLSALLQEKAVVVYFYPRDETPVCTAQACGFRDAYQAFLDAGAEVVGISEDSEDSHRSFADHHRLPFLLVSDPDGRIGDAWGVKPSLFGLLKGRVTFVVDRQGVVRQVTQAQMSAGKHIKESLAALRAISAG